MGDNCCVEGVRLNLDWPTWVWVSVPPLGSVPSNKSLVSPSLPFLTGDPVTPLGTVDASLNFSDFAVFMFKMRGREDEHGRPIGTGRQQNRWAVYHFLSKEVFREQLYSVAGNFGLLVYRCVLGCALRLPALILLLTVPSQLCLWAAGSFEQLIGDKS